MWFKLINSPQQKSYTFILKDGNKGGLNDNVHYVLYVWKEYRLC